MLGLINNIAALQLNHIAEPNTKRDASAQRRTKSVRGDSNYTHNLPGSKKIRK